MLSNVKLPLALAQQVAGALGYEYEDTWSIRINGDYVYVTHQDKESAMPVTTMHGIDRG
jgi:hypothetical protein